MTIPQTTLPNIHLFAAQRLPLTQYIQFFQISDLLLEIFPYSYRLFLEQGSPLHCMFLVLSELLHTDMEKSSLLPSSQRKEQNKYLGSTGCLNCYTGLPRIVQQRRGVCCSYYIAQ